MSQDVLIFSGGVSFDLVHSKRCGMSVGRLRCTQGSILMSLCCCGVTWRPGEVLGMTYSHEGTPEPEQGEPNGFD